MKSKKFVKETVEELKLKTKTMLTNKYFNYFMDSYIINGPAPEANDYIMKQFWAVGTVASFPIKHTDEIGFAPYATQKYNMYDFPEVVQIINKKQLPFFPVGNQVVKKDVVIGWIQSNHKSINDIVNYYIDRLVTVEMVINTNLQVSKLPWLIGVTPTDIQKAQDIVDRILNDEPVIFADVDDLNMIKSVVTNTPYIIDKLYMYKTSIENELLTCLGLDNVISQRGAERLIVDQVNANNAVINANQESFLRHLQVFVDEINEAFGVSFSVEATHKPVESVYDEGEGISSPYGGKEDERDQ